jgi:alanine dehydrogenase
MRIGVVKEIKAQEYRVAMTPSGARELVAGGHQVLVESQAGSDSGFVDAAYTIAGAEIVLLAKEVFARADLIVKVKEPQARECKMLRPGQVLFTYLHLAAEPQLTQLLRASGATCIAYETVTDSRGGLPLLAPMSEVAGRLALQAGAYHLQKEQGGKGVLLGGVPGVAPASVVVIGAGIVGTQAARMALGLGGDVTIIDKSLPRLRALDNEFSGRLRALYSTSACIEECVLNADLVIGAVLIPGAMAPKLVSRNLIARMSAGSVVVDVAIDQGGCFETSRPTTHQNPTYIEHGVVHYCVANMPSGASHTATVALTNATLPFVLEMANTGVKEALQQDDSLAAGVNVCAGSIVHPAVAASLKVAGEMLDQVITKVLV